MAEYAKANSGVGFGMVKITYNAKEQVETAFTGFIKGLGTNTVDDASRLEDSEVSSSKNQMPMVAGEITRFGNYDQVPTRYHHLAHNCAMKSHMVPNMHKLALL